MGINCKQIGRMKSVFQRLKYQEEKEKQELRKADKKKGKQYLKVQTTVSKIVFKDNILNDDIVDFMDKKGITYFWYERTELLDIDEEKLVNSYLDKFHEEIMEPYLYKSSHCISEPGYWYANQLYAEIKRLTKFVGGDEEDMTYEIVEPGYCWDIPYAHRIIRNVKDFHEWMLENGKNNI